MPVIPTVYLVLCLNHACSYCQLVCESDVTISITLSMKSDDQQQCKMQDKQ